MLTVAALSRAFNSPLAVPELVRFVPMNTSPVALVTSRVELLPRVRVASASPPVPAVFSAIDKVLPISASKVGLVTVKSGR